MDLISNLAEGEEIVLHPNAKVEVNCGFSMQLPPSWKAEISVRSGWARKGLIVTNAPGQVDEDYRGPIILLLINAGNETIIIPNNERIAQMWPAPVYKFHWITDEPLDDSARGTGGFGSTGNKP